MNDIENIIILLANEKILEIHEKGFIKQGCNGPYKCIDTPVRNSAHWISIFKYLWKKTKQKKYYDSAVLLANFIINGNFISDNGSIKCMNDDGKMDNLNGSIGQGWAIEGLIEAYKLTSDEKYYKNAKRIFLSQTYDKKMHLWNRIELDGKNIGFDKVFNHQLWFAASGFMIINEKTDKIIEEQLFDFMKHLDENIDVYKDGLFKHYIRGLKKEKKDIKMIIKKCLSFLRVIDPRYDTRYFEKAYHLFDLYGFAIIYEINNHFAIFKSEKFMKSLEYGLDIDKFDKDFNIERYLNNNKIKYNKYSYSYNSPALEYPYVDYIFNGEGNKNKYELLIAKQIKFNYNQKEHKFNFNTDDPNTLSARLYELTKYLERKL